MRSGTVAAFVGVLHVFSFGVGEAAPVPIPRKGTTAEADAWLTQAYPTMVKEIKNAQHRFIIRFPDSTVNGAVEHVALAVAAKEVVFTGGGKVTLKDIWYMGYLKKAKQDAFVYWRIRKQTDKIELEFNRPVKRLADCEKAMIRYWSDGTLTIGTLSSAAPAKTEKSK